MIPVEKSAQTAPDYEAPQIVDYGDLLELTAGASDGCFLDSDFPSGTMKSQLGFSC